MERDKVKDAAKKNHLLINIFLIPVGLRGLTKVDSRMLQELQKNFFRQGPFLFRLLRNVDLPGR
jgi:hypothetical protein